MIFFERFMKTWGSTGPKVQLTEPQQAQGWDAIGPAPPTVEQFNGVQNYLDAKDNWLFSQIKGVTDNATLTLQPDYYLTLLEAIRFLINNVGIIGEVKAIATASLPAGYVFCAGQELSRTTYAALFAKIGSIYGGGNNSTTFNIPDLRGRTIFGSDFMVATLPRANRLNSQSGTTGLLGASGGHQLLHAHDHSYQQVPHSHNITINAEGSHIHSVYADTAGAHSHQGWTSTDGLHSHQQGSESQYSLYGGGIQLGLGDPWRYGDGVDTYPSFTYQSTSNNGLHNHITQTDNAPGHAHNLFMGANGSHAHIATASAESAGVSFSSSGGGNSQNIPPFVAMNFVIFTGVF